MDYLSVKEFAAAASVSPQAVYKQLEKRLLPYVKEIDGKKFISREALELYSTSLTTSLTTELNGLKADESRVIDDERAAVIQPTIQPVVKPNNQDKEELELMKTMVDMLQKELDRKDAALLDERKRVDDLNERLAAAYGKISDMSNQIADMANKAQYITAADKTEKILEMKAPSMVDLSPDQKSFDGTESEEKKNTRKKKKKRLFSWFK